MLLFIQSRVLTEHPLGTRTRVAEKPNSLLHSRWVSTVERAIDPRTGTCAGSASIRQCQRRVDFSLLLPASHQPGCSDPKPTRLSTLPSGMQLEASRLLWRESHLCRRASSSPFLVIPDFHRHLEKCHLDQIAFKLFTDSRLK